MSSAKKKITFKVAHSVSGVQDIAFHPNGEQIVTCGADGSARLFNIKAANTPDNACVENESSQPYNSVAVAKFGDRFMVGSEDHVVSLYSFPAFEFISILARFALPVNAVAFNSSGSIAAAGGEEGNIKFIMVDTAQATTVKAHAGSILSLSFDPKGKFLASASNDGSLIIWDVSAGTNKLTTIPITKVGPDVAYQRLRISWDNEGKFLAVPGDQDVVILERDTWQQVAVLKDRHSSAVSLTAWSPNGMYLATADLDGKLVIWDMGAKEDLETYSHDKVITGLAWNPAGNGLVVIDVNGKYGIWDNIIPSKFPHPTHGTQAEMKKVKEITAMLDSERKEAEAEAEAAKAEADSDDDDSEPETGVTMKRLKRRIVEADDDDVIANDDENTEMKDETEKKKSKKERREDTRRERPLAPQFHPPIQPGATEEGRKRRFLAYNMVGSILTRDEGLTAAVEIEFADAAFHNKITVNDHHNYSLAALNEHGAVFASRATVETVDGEEIPVPSTIGFRPFSSWANGAEWTMQLSEIEDAVCVGISKTAVLVATTRHYLRVFTHGGAQKSIMCIPGAPVCVCAEDDWVALVYNAFPGLALMLINLQDGSTRYEGGLPLSPSSTLTWVGFAGDTVCTADSAGLVRGLMHVWRESCAAPRWVPLVDFTVQRMAGDTHWVVGINEKQLICVICKGENSPQVLPRPVLSVVNLAIPVVQRGDASELEEQYLRDSLFLNGKYRSAMARGESFAALNKATAVVDATLVRLIQNACKKDHQIRAHDFACMLTLQKSLNIAMKVAHNERRTVVKDKMSNLLESFENRESRAELEMDKTEQRDQIINAMAAQLTQLDHQYTALLASHAENALTQRVDASAVPAHVNGHASAAKAEPKASKLKALSRNGNSNGHSRAQKREVEEEEEKGEEKGKKEDKEEEEEVEEKPGKYISPYESEEEEEEEDKEDKEDKEEKDETEQKEKEKEEEKEKKEEKEQKREQDEEEEKEKEAEQEEEEQPKKKAAKKGKDTETKKGKGTAVKKAAGKATKKSEKEAKKSEKETNETQNDDTQKTKKPRGKKAVAAKKDEKPKPANDGGAKGPPKNPFAIKKHPTTPKGQKDDNDVQDSTDRKRKQPSDKTSPNAPKTKQLKLI